MHRFLEDVMALSREKADAWIDETRALRTVAADIGQYAVDRLRDLRHGGRRATDPMEAVLNQLVLELSYGLIEAKKAVAVSIADDKRISKQWEQEEANADEWVRRAVLADQAGGAALATEAREREDEHRKLAEALGVLSKRHQAEVEQLKNALRQLANRIERAKRDKNHLVTRRVLERTQDTLRHELRQLDQVVALLDGLSAVAESTSGDGVARDEGPLH
jgi:phage shock protein A